MMDTMHNLPAMESEERGIIELLDRHLATALDLQFRIRQALWNFEDQRLAETRELRTAATEIEQFCERIAIRLRALGIVAQATPQKARAQSFLDPYPLVVAGDQEYISAIDGALAKFRHSVRQAREKAAAFRDETTAALFGTLASTIDTQIWFLRSPSR
jgi:starvation-inducible DNA-binding protein